MADPAVASRTTMLVPRFQGDGRIGSWERPIPEPGPGELLIRVRANAICGTDRAQWLRGSAVTPGHEAAGVVAAVGSSTHVPVGTQGVIYLMDYCGRCRSCSAGATNQCTAKRADMGFTHDGGYGQYELVHQTNFFVVDADLPLAEATLLLDVMGTTAHALGRAEQIRSDIRSVVVAGAGPIGLGAVAMTRILWGKDLVVIATDIAPYRLALAERLGATPVDLRRETLRHAVERSGLADSPDVAIETAGKSGSRTACLDILGRRGVLVCVGHGEDLRLDVSDQLIAPERAVMGSEYFRYGELSDNLRILRDNRDYLAQIITHHLPIGEVEAAYRLFMSGATGKVVIEQ